MADEETLSWPAAKGWPLTMQLFTIRNGGADTP